MMLPNIDTYKILYFCEKSNFKTLNINHMDRKITIFVEMCNMNIQFIELYYINIYMFRMLLRVRK